MEKNYPFSDEKIPRYPLSTPRARPFLHRSGNSASSPFSPWDIYDAYDIDYRGKPGENVKIAVIEAFSAQGAEKDFEIFAKSFSLPENRLHTAFPFGKTSFSDPDWETETRADTQWAFSLAPYAEITAVFAKNDETESLLRAAEYASRELGADVVSMSFGTHEFPSQTAFDKIFSSKSTVFTASSGDTASEVFFPSSSASVISVGGCALHRNAGGNTFARSAWRDGGGGPSRYEGIPKRQKWFSGISALSGKFRATPDVALDASLSPGYPVYDSSSGGFISVGGTSVAAPVFAAFCARILQKSNHFKNYVNLADYLYAAAGETAYREPQAAFYDITVGNSGKYKALVGYDFCTGLGAPNINYLER